MDMQSFVASSKYCRTHEAGALDMVARRVFACVEEAAVNEAAAKVAQMRWGKRHESTILLPFVR